MVLGFTGTRNGLTPAQRAALADCVSALPERAIHGGAIGADSEFNAFLVGAGMDPDRIDVHPASIARSLYWQHAGNTVYAVAPPLVRNHTIVRRCDHLIACPATAREVLRSGTWATFRAARKFGRATTIVLPDGSIREKR